MYTTKINEMCKEICNEYGYNTPNIVLVDMNTHFGRYNHLENFIVLNKSLCELNSTKIIRDLLKHIIIHLKFHNHGSDFEAECKRMGIQRHTRFDHPIIKLKHGIIKFKCEECIKKSKCNTPIRECLEYV